MRISSLQVFNNGLAGMQRSYGDVARTQEQISSGKRILTASDDPVASVRLLQLGQEKNVLTQHKDNLTAATNSLNQEEVILDSVNTALHRVRELALSAGNGSFSQAERQSLAVELGAREEELMSLMNSRNARGEYLFSGFQGSTQPFVKNGDGSYSYQGDEGQRSLQIGSSLNAKINDNGKKVFENITNAGRLMLGGTTAANELSGAQVRDEVSFAKFPANGLQVDIEADDAGAPTLYRITPILTPAEPGPPLVPAVLDASKELTGTLKAGEDTLVSYGGVDFFINGTAKSGVTATQGASFTLSGPSSDPATVNNKVGILDTIANLRKVLEASTDTPEGGRVVRDAMALALTNIDHAMVNVDAVRGDIGSRLNVIASAQTANEEASVLNHSVQSELQDLDYAEALSRLSFQSVILEAAQQSYVKISNLSLFNKM